MSMSGIGGWARVSMLALAALLAIPGGRAAAVLPSDFDQRFEQACAKRGLSPERCACIREVVLELVADEHLSLMLLYFEGEQQLDERMMEELENDEQRFNSLKQEIEEAVEAARRRCPR
jgi:hypothetical protein